jgi:hypothetical protein
MAAPRPGTSALDGSIRQRLRQMLAGAAGGGA